MSVAFSENSLCSVFIKFYFQGDFVIENVIYSIIIFFETFNTCSLISRKFKLTLFQIKFFLPKRLCGFRNFNVLYISPEFGLV